MRATSRSRTLEPSVLARSTALPNSSAEVSWPFTTTVAEMPWPATLGSSPMVPEETCAFCVRIAATTSAEDRLYPCSLAGSIHTRIARSVPNSCACPTPAMRWISGSTLREA